MQAEHVTRTCSVKRRKVDRTGSVKAGTRATGTKCETILARDCHARPRTQAHGQGAVTRAPRDPPRRSDMTGGVGNAHAHWAAAATRASLDLGHVRYHAMGALSTQGSCNPHHAPGTSSYGSGGRTTRRAPSTPTPMNGASRPRSHVGSDVAAAVNV
jgi:hypothetical protein